MYYYFNNAISINNVNELVEKLSQTEGNINLYFSTSGGHSPSMTFLIKYFNSIKDRITITLIEDIWSAGTHILIDFEGKIEICVDEMDSFLFHVADRESYNIRKDSNICNQQILSKQDKEFNINFAEKIKKKGLLTDKQLKQFLNGRDVIVYKEQFGKWKLN